MSTAPPSARASSANGTLGLVSGTWGINQVVTREPIVDKRLFMTTLFAVPGLWLTIDGSATSATNLEWFVAQFCGEERNQAADAASRFTKSATRSWPACPPPTSSFTLPVWLQCAAQRARRLLWAGGLAHQGAHAARALRRGGLRAPGARRQATRRGRADPRRALHRRRLAQPCLVTDVCRRARPGHRGARRQPR